MELKILGWEYKAIRAIDELEISLKKSGASQPYKSNLILMPNGVGKTTTIELLRAIFDGEAKNWSEEKVKSYCPPNSGISEGQFKVKTYLDGNKMILGIELDYDTGEARYFNTSPGVPGGLEYGELPPEIKDSFTSEFVRRFIFDGELAEDILENQKNEAEETIEILYSLDRIRELKTATVDRIVEDYQEQNLEETNTKTQKGLSKLESKKSEAEEKLDELKEERDKLRDKIKTKKDKRNDIDEKIDKQMEEDEELKEEYNQSKLRKEELEGEIKSLTTEALHLGRDPFYLHERIADRLTRLSENMQTLQLPRTTSEEFFHELAESPECICGREIGKEESEFIKQKASNYLSEDNVGVLNEIKTALRNRDFSSKLSEKLDKLKNLRQELQSVNNEIDRIVAEREKKGDTKTEELRKEKDDLSEEIQNAQNRLDRLTSKEFEEWGSSLNWRNNIPLCEKKVDDLTEKWHEAGNTLEFAEKADFVETVLQKIEKKTLKKLKKRVLRKSNEKISKIIQTEDIEIKSIDGYLELEQRGGASVGQSLAIAYSFLGSMFEDSVHTVPFVVDSPANPLDVNGHLKVQCLDT
ncbi:MAG: AAA family ATPase [Flavobacteriales bacterium]